MRSRTLIAVLAAAALMAVAVAAPLSSSGAAGPQAEIAKKKKCKSKQKKTAKVGDDFFTPTSLSIKKCAKVKWKWLPDNGNPHNVTVTNAPKKVSKKERKKNFTSATGSIGIKFSAKFKKPGRYDFICTIHPTTMQMTVKVKKKK